MNGGSVIALAALQQRMLDDDVLLVDCRFDLADPDRGATEYARGHPPGAVYAHLNHDLSDLRKLGLGRHPLPDVAGFAARLAAWGYRADRQVVVFDQSSGAIAARCWWMLRALGQQNVSVLDGGFAAWQQAGLALSAGDTKIESRGSDEGLAVGWPDQDGQAFALADYALVERVREDPAWCLLDARAAARYRGEVEPIDPVAGHIPGAGNRPFSDNLDESGRFKTQQRLAAEFAELLGAVPADRVIHMCGSGVTAAHNLLAMEYAGLSGSRLFVPSWSGWVKRSACDMR